MASNRPPFLPGITYHVFNRSNNRELLFKEEQHYAYFLQRFRDLVAPHVEVWAYCLMPTHFHILLTVKRPESYTASADRSRGMDMPERIITGTGQEIIRLASEIERRISEVLQTSEILSPSLRDAQANARRIQEIAVESSVFQRALPVEKAFKDFFISYSKSINEALGRSGSLFQPKYKRKEVTDDWYLWRLIWYIHQNPVRANLCGDCSDWKWSSFAAITGDKATLVRRDLVLDAFGGQEAFLETHRRELPQEDVEKIKDFAG